MKTPVAFIIFNRPDKTSEVFAAIRRAQPPKLFVIADGPRLDRSSDVERCAATRSVIEQVDWECEVFKNYSDENLGCGMRVSTGINWVFENVEDAIILEDDCIPHATFFHFCEILLEYYRFDQRVISISGCNFNMKRLHTSNSYFFSRYPNIWGWATWRRAWKYYDFHMKLWPQVKKEKILEAVFADDHIVMNWAKRFQIIYEKKIDTWDYQWTLACFLQSGLNILPKVNLVTNIGYGSDATHTSLEDELDKDIPVEPMAFPLKHPEFVIRDSLADEHIQDARFDYHSKVLKRVRIKLSRIVERYCFKFFK